MDKNFKRTDNTTNLIRDYLKQLLPKMGKVAVVFVLAAVTDSFTNYVPIRDLNFMDYRVSMLITIIIAIVLDGTPIIIGDLMNHYSDYKLKNDDKAARIELFWIIGLCGMLLFLFTLLFLLRWNGRNDLYSQSHISIIDGSGSYHTTQGEDFMTILLGLLPVATSIFTFALTKTNNSLSEIRRIVNRIKYAIADGEIIKLELEVLELYESAEITYSMYDGPINDCYKDIYNAQCELAKIYDDISREKGAYDPDAVTLVTNKREDKNIKFANV